MVTHPCINQAHDCLTSVIKHKTFSPYYVSPCMHIDIHFCLLTWAAYFETFRIDIIWIRVSCCLVCSCINWFTHYLISCGSLVVAVPVIHFSASPKKSNRLLLDHGFSGGDRFSKSVLSNCTADCMVGLWDI